MRRYYRKLLSTALLYIGWYQDCMSSAMEPGAQNPRLNVTMACYL